MRAAGVIVGGVLIFVLLVGIGTIGREGRPDGVTVSVLTHCGLSLPRIWLEDEPYRFDVPAIENNAPMGWGEPTQDITIKREGDQWVAYGPWFSRYVLVPDPGAEQDGCM